jgi:hypothetical protein
MTTIEALQVLAVMGFAIFVLMGVALFMDMVE